MILAEQHQSPDGSSGAIVKPASSNDDDNLSSVEVHREENDDTDRNRSALVQLPPTGYNNNQLVAATTSSSEDEDEDSSSGSSVAVDEDIPMDELEQRGWMNNASLGSEVNGIALPGSDAIQIGKIHATNTPNMHIGQRVFIKSKGDVIIKSVSYNTPITSEDQKQALENGSIHSDKDKDGISNFGSTLGPKLSTATDTSDNPLYPSPHGRVAEWCLSRRCTIIICVAALVLLLITVLVVLLTSSSGTANAPIPPYNPASPNDTSINNDPTIKGVRMVRRVEWGAQPPANNPTKLIKLPPPYVIISHTASTFCYTQAQCVLNVRVAQTFHIESKGWDDIAYNFLVGGDGNVYEGRGWNVEGAHTFNYNSMSIGISFIGTFNTDPPTNAQVYAARKLIEFGVENGYISKDYILLGHRQCVKTESPGEVLYNIIKTWEHWSPTP